MNEKQALDLLKAALDLATSKGVFATLNDSAAVIEAFNTLSKKLLQNDSKEDASAN